MTDTGKEAAELSFGAAMQELEGILRRVESEETDIDELADELKRAAALLETCRAKIRRAEVEVSQIVQNLDRPGGAGNELPAADGEAAKPGEDAPRAATRGETATLFDTGD
ncbi:MAG: exodeoxyribonuclease VII small subunit [Acidobacteriota bacterium]|nr:exodeoxyribonuclease VII small subunit [Acidobacteriota bacterium]MDH3524015.1 exodeoxyribonuclease VII small subunit [Acidobacteriota bacterium]